MFAAILAIALLLLPALPIGLPLPTCPSGAAVAELGPHQDPGASLWAALAVAWPRPLPWVSVQPLAPRAPSWPAGPWRVEGPPTVVGALVVVLQGWPGVTSAACA